MKHSSGALALVIIVMMSAVALLTGCGQASGTTESYFVQQEVRESPSWVSSLDAAADADQMIVVAGVDKTTAYITMHQKDADGTWQQLIATPGFIGLDGLGQANINDCYTPVGAFVVGRAFGLADDPGCKLGYTKVDDSYYWSGDPEHDFNQLVSINDVPGLDTEASEHIADYDYAYQYVLDMGYNTECQVEKGFAFFFHSFRVNRTYTGGCVAVPEDVMRFVMQHVEPGCVFVIDSLENFGGNLDD